MSSVKLRSAAAPVAFPGAEGFGAAATGGRGGRVLYVTTTAADGVGSLQWALDQPGPKYVLFRTSGLIDARIHLRSDDVTIAGHTSPGGITIRGFVTDETPFQDQAVRRPERTAENWILQHIRIRPGVDGPSDDGLRLRYTRNAIVDHVSIGNATDEAVEISYSNNITLQNSIFAETLGGHSFYGGMLLNYSNPAHGFALDNLSIHHNLFTRIEGRLPEVSRESAGAASSVMNLELTSNLYWDPRFFIALAADTGVVTDESGDPYPVHYRLNAINNYFRTADGFPYGMWDDQILRTGSAPLNQLYVQGNRSSLYPDRSDFELFHCCNDYPLESAPDATARLAQQMDERHPFPLVTATAAEELPVLLAGQVGAWPRDPMDSRLLEAVRRNRLDPGPLNRNPAGDALLPSSPAPPPPPTDRDNDGMPDDWERSQGLDPDQPNHNAFTLSSEGYTDLEVYLHHLAAQRIGEETVREPAFQITAEAPRQPEGLTRGARFRFRISRSGDPAGEATVHWQVEGAGGAPAQADDFGPGWPAGIARFAAGETTRWVSVAVQADHRAEADERFRMRLSEPIGADLAGRQSSSIATIVNDDWSGGAGNDRLRGTAAADFLDGRGGRDSLTGAAGADVFAFRFGDSPVPSPDRITDFRFGSDRIALLRGAGEATAAVRSLHTKVDHSALNLGQLAERALRDADGERPGDQPLGPMAAVLVQSRQAGIAGTHLLVNDREAGLNPADDLMIRLGEGNAALPLGRPLNVADLLA
ncbi:MAG: hypothetical protein VKI63_08760 [Cyanobium sp.]|nr:hypothetical protein [Cyanobium sp.]